MATTPPIYWPFPTSKVTGWPGSYRGHVGTDFGIPIGTPVLACFAGTVVFVGGDGASGTMNGVRANGEGKTIDIRRADGLIARYGHLNGYNVTVGQTVVPGDVLGWSGNTGYSTGPHLHWELRWDRLWSGGRWVDPRTLNPQTLGSAPANPIPLGGLPMFAPYWTGPTPASTRISGRIVTDYGSFHVPTPQIMHLLNRRHTAALKPGMDNDNMLDAEHDIINNFLRACFQSALTGVQLDAERFLKAINEGFAKLGKSISVTADSVDIDPEDLLAALELAVPRIADAMVKQAGKKLAS